MKVSNLFVLLCLALAIVSCSKDEDAPAADKNNGNVNTPDARQAAINDYRNMYLASTVNNFTWNGNTSNCNAGTLSQDVLDKALLRIHYFRKVAGLSNDGVVLVPELNAKSQESALMTKANNKLSHFPTSDWKCYTADGAEAAAKGNMGMGVSDVANVDLFMEDEGEFNKPVGHRRWILYSRATDFGFGCTDNSSTMWCVNDNSLSLPLPASAPEFIAWPPANYIPSGVVYPRWSFSVPGKAAPFQIDFTNATVTMKDASGANVPLVIEYANPSGIYSYGDNTLVWRPSGIQLNSSADQKYTVTISNVLVEGVSKNYTYDVIIMNP